jgi:hypothetical protein
MGCIIVNGFGLFILIVVVDYNVLFRYDASDNISDANTVKRGQAIDIEEGSDDDDDGLFTHAIGDDDGEETDEIMHQKEEELQAELAFATQRCQELHRTLEATKSVMSSFNARPGVAADAVVGSRRDPGGAKPVVPVVADTYDEDYEDEVCVCDLKWGIGICKYHSFCIVQ